MSFKTCPRRSPITSSRNTAKHIFHGTQYSDSRYIAHEQVRRNSEFGTSGGLNSLTRELRSYIGMDGTNGGFACG